MNLLDAIVRETQARQDGPLRIVLRGFDRLAEMERRGLDESPEADAIRDTLDAPWGELDDAGREAASRYSAIIARRVREEIKEEAKSRRRLASLAGRSGPKGDLAGHLEELIRYS